jgi:hypothetical protein
MRVKRDPALDRNFLFLFSKLKTAKGKVDEKSFLDLDPDLSVTHPHTQYIFYRFFV